MLNKFRKFNKYFKYVLLFALVVITCQAQQQQPVAVAQPDCVVFFKLGNTTGLTLTSGTLNNRQLGCTKWGVFYTSTGLSGLTLTFQDAPDSNGVAGTFITFAGTTKTGSNPMTSIVNTESTFTGYYPWLRVILSGLTGSGAVSGSIYGYRENASTIQGAGGGGGCVSPCIVIGPNAPGAASTQSPVQAAGNDGTLVRALKTDTAGRTLIANNSQAGVPYYSCDLSAVFNFAGAGATQIVAASGSLSVYVCGISFSTTAPEDVKLVYGTGANCVTGTADLTGLYKSIQSAVFSWTPLMLFKTPASQSLCLNQSAAQALGGTVFYAQY